MTHEAELARMRAAYATRDAAPAPAAPAARRAVGWMRAEREAVYRRHLTGPGMPALDALELCEVGCGAGGELARMIALGLDPARLTGVELIESRLETARATLPPAVRLLGGDASATALEDASCDVVLASTVFTSILDAHSQATLAAECWRLLRPGGAVLWYDFRVDNPRNPDVRGVPARRVRALFPHAVRPVLARVTLAPPIARRLGRLPGALGHAAYHALAAIPPLRTHLVAWLPKALP